VVLAHPVVYRPRPVFQSYAAYTPALAALNRAHLADPAGPRHVLFDAETIDHRYPLMDDAASLAVLWSHFDVGGVVGPFVHFARRSAPRPYTLVEGPVTRAPLAAWIDVPGGETPIWATVTVERSWLGRLAAVLYKLPPVVIDVATADGVQREFRLVRALGPTGFVASPLVSTPAHVVDLLAGRPPEAARQVRRWRVRPTWSWAYAEEMQVRFSPLPVPAR
jgi:hypothetical protein